MTDGSFKVAECAGSIACTAASAAPLGGTIPMLNRQKLTELHVHARDLDPALHKGGHEVQALLQILLCANRIADQESMPLSAETSPVNEGMWHLLEGTTQVVSFCLTLLPADALVDSLVDERHGVVVVRRGQRVESQQQRLVSLGWVFRQRGLGVCTVVSYESSRPASQASYGLRGRKAERYEEMKVGEGSLGSRFSRISLAFFVDSFFRHRSTAAAAASSWNRSMMVVAVKSRSESARRPGRIVDCTLTADSLLLATQVLQSCRSPLQGLDAVDCQSRISRANESSSLGSVKCERLVAVVHTLLVLWGRVVGEA